MSKTNIGISAPNRTAVVKELNKVLADEFVLYTKTLRAHWNLEGHDFHTKHEFFEEHYNTIKGFVDSVAERIRKLGHYSPGTLKQFLQLTHLTEQYEGGNTSQDYMKLLLSDHEAIIMFIRGILKPIEEEHKDAGTTDFLTGLMMEHEEMAWMLRASIE